MYDLIGGMRGLQRRAARGLPMMRRSRRPNPAVLATPIVAVAGVATVAGMLLWDERRRSAMRKRMEDLANSVGSSVSSSVNRVAPKVPAGAGQD